MGTLLFVPPNILGIACLFVVNRRGSRFLLGPPSFVAPFLPLPFILVLGNEPRVVHVPLSLHGLNSVELFLLLVEDLGPVCKCLASVFWENGNFSAFVLFLCFKQCLLHLYV